MQFETLPVGPLQANCYILWDTDTREAAIIDPGGDKAIIDRVIGDKSLRVAYILLTHGHFDHCFVAGDVAREYSAPIAMHADDVVQLEDGTGLAEMFCDMSSYVEFLPDKLISDGDVLRLGDSPIEVLHTPGHSEGGVCFVTEVGVFSGDTLFAGSIGRTDFLGGSYPQLMASIETKLLSMKDETPLFPGHGLATTIGQERATNPFLR